MYKTKIIRIFNIKFLDINPAFVSSYFKKRIFLVFPAAPTLADISNHKIYHQALKKADYAMFDSGYLVLLLRIFKGIKVNKLSGYKFLNLFFQHLKFNNKKLVFTIDPNKEASVLNQRYLKKIGVNNINSYIAPKYNSLKLQDIKLLKEINLIKPDFVLTNIGGGVQEILGLYLKDNLKVKTSIFCTGGAIAFFTGQQAPINKFFDNFYLGWFIRILFNPKIFLFRYLKAFRLIFLVIKEKIVIR